MTEHVAQVAPVVDRPTTSGDDTDTVLVVGAGSVGLAAASELARQGARVRLVDALPAPTTESRAVGLDELTEGCAVTPPGRHQQVRPPSTAILKWTRGSSRKWAVGRRPLRRVDRVHPNGTSDITRRRQRPRT